MKERGTPQAAERGRVRRGSWEELVLWSAKTCRDSSAGSGRGERNGEEQEAEREAFTSPPSSVLSTDILEELGGRERRGRGRTERCETMSESLGQSG